MLILPIKKKWFDMILLGQKKEEYREIKPYWTTRFEKVLSFKMVCQPVRMPRKSFCGMDTVQMLLA